MNIITLDMFFRKVINYEKRIKISLKNDVDIYKIFIFTTSIVNRLTMYAYTNQLFTNKPKQNDKH